MQKTPVRNPWMWIPSLYFGQAIPYVVVMTMSVLMYKDLGVGNEAIALYTSLLYLPWVIKPLWSPVIDMFRTKRWWTTTMQLLIGVALAVVGFTLHLPAWFQLSLVVMCVMAFCSATHDIAADGFYMLGLKQYQQAEFVGVRSTFYRIATIVAGGMTGLLAEALTRRTGDVAFAWSVVFYVLAGMFLALFAWHSFVLDRPAQDHAVLKGEDKMKEFFATFAAFFRKRDIWLILGFILTFRLGESQLLKLAIPFLKDPIEKGGLGLTTGEVGIVYSGIGITALTIGGLLGGFVISRLGLKRALWLMVFAVHIPDLVFVYLATVQPQNFYVISAFIAFEQFGYGFGFTAMMLYMIMVADGEHKTAHYAICTGFMALGMMLPGMVSGYIQQYLGYQNFFIYVCIMTLPAFLMAALVKIDPEFAKKPAE